MSDAAPLIEIEVPARAEFVRLVRLVMAGIGNVARFNLEEIEDLKLAAGEACYATFQGAQPRGARVRLSARVLEDGVEVSVAREHLPEEVPLSVERARESVGFNLLEHVVDEVDLDGDPQTTRIRMRKRREILPGLEIPRVQPSR